jgi:hypothetical protein
MISSIQASLESLARFRLDFLEVILKREEEACHLRVSELWLEGHTIA